MRILLACEESQSVCEEFRKIGHQAFSCDILECSGPNPEWHIQGDVLEVINQDWDLMIAFPPCTHLAVSGARHFEKKKQDGRQKEGIDFFMKIVNAPIPKIAIENPIGIMSKVYRKPDQIIQPYFFGDEAQKTTCLWLKNLPKLYHNKEVNLFDSNVTHVDKGEFFQWTSKDGKQKKQPMWYADAFKLHSLDGAMRSKLRSKTFPGIAKAMANQWG
jgi:site-specific DNA-cytosine methylase